VHLDPPLGHHRRGHLLDAEVECRDDERLLAPLDPGRGHDVRLRRGDLAGQLGPGHLARPEHAGEQRLGVGLRRGDPDPHGAPLTEVTSQRAGVDPGDPDDALLAQLVVEGAA